MFLTRHNGGSFLFVPHRVKRRSFFNALDLFITKEVWCRNHFFYQLKVSAQGRGVRILIFPVSIPFKHFFNKENVNVF